MLKTKPETNSTNKVAITFLPKGMIHRTEPGTKLIDAASQAGLPIEAPCGGKGTCGKCLVRVVQGELVTKNLASLTPEAVAEGLCQACRARIGKSDVTVEILESKEGLEGAFIVEDETHMVQAELLLGIEELSPKVTRLRATVPLPIAEDGLGDVDRMMRTVATSIGPRTIKPTLAILGKLSESLRKEEGRITLTLQNHSGITEIIDVAPGHDDQRLYGAAIDLGTTTVVAQLVDLERATVLATRSDFNAQIVCGSDIISRINYSQKPGGLEKLQQQALESINNLLSQVAGSRGIDVREITALSLSGNTTMVHLLLGLNPDYLRREPYTPTVLKVAPHLARNIGINIHPKARIDIGPAVGSYVGGDITSGLLTTDLTTDSEALSLFIDVGTNGEIAVGNNELLMGCACSAGPAFEGGGVEHGMRAAVGAIEKVQVNPSSGLPRYSTIGDAPPRGICGSGMIDLLANLFVTGWLDPMGKINRDRSSPAIRLEGKRARYRIAAREESALGDEIYVDEIDIQNIIRAKAAIYSASKLLLEQLGARFDDLEHIYIAGGFGRSIELEQAIVLGLLPDVPLERFHFVGNASLIGTYMALISKNRRQAREELAQRMTYIDLSTDPGYMDQYTAALFLPHTDRDLFPSVAVKVSGY